MPEEIIYNGALPDDRTVAQASGDWQHVEMFGSGSGHVWVEKPMAEWNSYPISNQDGSGMCGPFSATKSLGINEQKENGNFTFLNKAFIYNKRMNSGPGMFFYNLLDLACSIGAPSDPLRISENINDEQASKIVFETFQDVEAKKYRGKNYLYATVNIDTIAGIVDQGYTPILLLRCAFSEYTAEPTVNPTLTEADLTIGHFVPVVDAVLHNGKKMLVIEDSWGQQYGYTGRRLFSEEFLNKRVLYVAYIVDLKNETLPVKPVHTFTQVLPFGSTGSDLVALQKILQYEKFLPTHTSTGQELPLGTFLGMTASALKKWQVSHNILDFANETDMRKIRFGLKSIAQANALYSSN